MLLVPLALGAYLVERNSWKPKTFMLPKVNLGGTKFSPDGRTIILRDCPVSEIETGDVLLFDMGTRELIAKIEDAESPFYLEDGKFFSVFFPYLGEGDSGQSRIISVPDTNSQFSLPRYFIPYDVLLDEKTLVGNMTNKADDVDDIYSWNFHTTDNPKPYFPTSGLLSKEAVLHGFLADKSTILAEFFPLRNKGRGTLQFWDVKSRKLRFSIHERDALPEGRSSMLAGHSSNATGLFAFYNFDRVEIWNYKTGYMRNSFPITIPNTGGHASGNLYLDKCALSPDGTLMVGGGIMGRSMVLWNTRTGKALREWNFPNNEYITGLDFSPDSRTLATSHGNGTVKLWRIK